MYNIREKVVNTIESPWAGMAELSLPAEYLQD
jgi:hypothetical protein